MAIGINFRKERAEQFLDCIEKGKPIENVRTVDDMLALAGACFFVAMSHGPIAKSEIDWAKVPKEHREARDVQLFAEIHAAIEFYGQLTMLVKDDEYDAAFEPQVRAAMMSEKTDGEQITPERQRAPERVRFAAEE